MALHNLQPVPALATYNDETNQVRWVFYVVDETVAESPITHHVIVTVGGAEMYEVLVPDETDEG